MRRPRGDCVRPLVTKRPRFSFLPLLFLPLRGHSIPDNNAVRYPLQLPNGRMHVICVKISAQRKLLAALDSTVPPSFYSGWLTRICFSCVLLFFFLACIQRLLCQGEVGAKAEEAHTIVFYGYLKTERNSGERGILVPFFIAATMLRESYFPIFHGI